MHDTSRPCVLIKTKNHYRLLFRNGMKSAVVASGYGNKWKEIITLYTIVYNFIKKDNAAAGLGSLIIQIG